MDDLLEGGIDDEGLGAGAGGEDEDGEKKKKEVFHGAVMWLQWRRDVKIRWANFRSSSFAEAQSVSSLFSFLAVASRRIERFDHEAREGFISITALFGETRVVVFAVSVHADVDDGGGGSAPFRGRSAC